MLVLDHWSITNMRDSVRIPGARVTGPATRGRTWVGGAMASTPSPLRAVLMGALAGFPITKITEVPTVIDPMTGFSSVLDAGKAA